MPRGCLMFFFIFSVQPVNQAFKPEFVKNRPYFSLSKFSFQEIFQKKIYQRIFSYFRQRSCWMRFFFTVFKKLQNSRFRFHFSFFKFGKNIFNPAVFFISSVALFSPIPLTPMMLSDGSPLALCNQQSIPARNRIFPPPPFRHKQSCRLSPFLRYKRPHHHFYQLKRIHVAGSHDGFYFCLFVFNFSQQSFPKHHPLQNLPHYKREC